MRPRIVGVILAAGRGTRLAPLTDTLPKCLIPLFGDRPILDYQLSALTDAAVHEVLITVGYKADLVRAFVARRFPHLQATFIENAQYESSNTYFSLSLVARDVGPDVTVLQMNGDVVFDPLLLARLLAADPAASYAATVEGRCAEEEVKILLAEGGSIVRMSKAVDASAAYGEAVGINVFAPPFWAALREDLLLNKEADRQSYFERGIERVIQAGGLLYPFPLDGLSAIEVDFPEDLQRARSLSFLRQ